MWNLRGRLQHKIIEIQVMARSVAELHAIKTSLLKLLSLV
jgi:hypothetical protein